MITAVRTSTNAFSGLASVRLLCLSVTGLYIFDSKDRDTDALEEKC